MEDVCFYLVLLELELERGPWEVRVVVEKEDFAFLTRVWWWRRRLVYYHFFMGDNM